MNDNETQFAGETAPDKNWIRENDPLGIILDLNDVDTSMPVLVEGLYILTIDKVEVVENKDKTGNNLLIIFKTAADATSLKGQAEGKEFDVKAGFPIRQYMPMQPNPNKPDARDFKENLAALQDAVTGSKKGNRGPFQPSTYVGRQVSARLKVTEDPEYGKQNNIARLAPVPQ